MKLGMSNVFERGGGGWRGALQNGVKGGEKCGDGNISLTLKYVSSARLFSGAVEKWPRPRPFCAAVVHQ